MLPDHIGLRNRLQAVAHSLKLTAFAFDQRDSSTVSVTDPWGQLFLILAASDKSAFDSGIQDIPLPCARGTAVAIGAFYEQLYKVCCYLLVVLCLVQGCKVTADKVYSWPSRPQSKDQEASIASPESAHTLYLVA